jgi:hypothetical protein
MLCELFIYNEEVKGQIDDLEDKKYIHPWRNYLQSQYRQQYIIQVAGYFFMLFINFIAHK